LKPVIVGVTPLMDKNDAPRLVVTEEKRNIKKSNR
jgi:hypothetical protein